ncbi:MAG: hypothetical protein FJX72_07595 [Armatimonadetes bacterium]|nr:hypothetical protein [Armatimonadota bacterium]
MSQYGHEHAVTGASRPFAWRNLPWAVRALAWATAALAVGVIGYRAHPYVVAPYRQAAVVEAANRRIERVALLKSREKDDLRKQTELADTDEGKRSILRRSQFVEKGQAHLLGDGIGSPPSEK